MKILLLGNFKKSYSTETWIAHALEELEIEVVREQEGGETMNALIEEKPDVFLIGKARNTPRLRTILNYCKENNILSVTWIFDIMFGFPRDFVARDAMFNTDIVLSTDGGHDDRWEANGIEHYTLRQGIHEPEAKLGETYDTDTEIVFVGSRNPWWPERTLLMNYLKRKYRNKFAWLGQRKQIRGTDLNDLFASVKIVMGDSVYSPHYWSNRIYETLGRGGFLLHPRVPGLEEEFEYYKHLIPYELNNHKQVSNLIDHYLKFNKEREKIRLAGHEYCKEHYTYKERCRELLKVINSKI